MYKIIFNSCIILAKLCNFIIRIYRCTTTSYSDVVDLDNYNIDSNAYLQVNLHINLIYSINLLEQINILILQHITISIQSK